MVVMASFNSTAATINAITHLCLPGQHTIQVLSGLQDPAYQMCL